MLCDIGRGQNFNARHFLQTSGIYKITNRLHRHKQSIRVQLCIEVFYKLTISVSLIKTCAKQFIFNLQFVFVGVVNNLPHPSVLKRYSCEIIAQSFPCLSSFLSKICTIYQYSQTRKVSLRTFHRNPLYLKKKILLENENNDKGTIVSVIC